MLRARLNDDDKLALWVWVSHTPVQRCNTAGAVILRTGLLQTASLTIAAHIAMFEKARRLCF